MQTKFELANGWKMLCGIVGIAFLYSFARSIYTSVSLSKYFLGNEITLFRTIWIVFFLSLSLFIITISGFMAYFLLYKFKKENLIISEDGIEQQSFGYKIHSNWVNVRNIKSIGTLGLINGIYVTPNSLDIWLKFPVKWLININQQGEYFIPLSMFDINWRDSELGQQMKQYAPHLFK